MPIKGVSEVRLFPRVGKVRLGERVRGEKSDYPRPTPYFVVKEDQSTFPEAAKAFREAYGEKPTEIEIMLVSNDMDVSFPQWLRRYKAGKGLRCKGDGERAWRMTESGEIEEIPCGYKKCPLYQAGECSRVATLQFVLPKVKINGVWHLDTSSWFSIVHINSALDLLRIETGGKIAFIPLKLLLRPQEVTVEGKKKKVYVLHVMLPRISFEEAMRGELRIEAAEIPLTPLPAEGEAVEPSLTEIPEDLFPLELVESINGPNGNPPEPATQAQLNRLRSLCRGMKISERRAAAYIGKDSFAGLTSAEAQRLLDELQFRNVALGSKKGPEVPEEIIEAARGLGWPQARAEFFAMARLSRGKTPEEILDEMRQLALEGGV